MNITLKDEKANRIEVDGVEYRRIPYAATSAQGIVLKYAEIGNSENTITFKKAKMMVKNPDVARIMFEPANWRI